MVKSSNDGWLRSLRRTLAVEKNIKCLADKDRYIPNAVWDSLKKKTFCEYCGKKRGKKRLQVHHIIPVSLGGSNERSNLMAVCRECHKILDIEALKEDDNEE